MTTAGDTAAFEHCAGAATVSAAAAGAAALQGGGAAGHAGSGGRPPVGAAAAAAVTGGLRSRLQALLCQNSICHRGHPRKSQLTSQPVSATNPVSVVFHALSPRCTLCWAPANVLSQLNYAMIVRWAHLVTHEAPAAASAAWDPSLQPCSKFLQEPAAPGGRGRSSQNADGNMLTPMCAQLQAMRAVCGRPAGGAGAAADPPPHRARWQRAAQWHPPAGHRRRGLHRALQLDAPQVRQAPDHEHVNRSGTGGLI